MVQGVCIFANKLSGRDAFTRTPCGHTGIKDKKSATRAQFFAIRELFLTNWINSPLPNRCERVKQDYCQFIDSDRNRYIFLSI